MRATLLLLPLLLIGCATARDPECSVDLSARAFVGELVHPQGTGRTPAFDDYTPGSYHVSMPTLLAAVRDVRTTHPDVIGVIAVGPSGPMWQYHVMLFKAEEDDVRANMLVMPHARITWKGIALVEESDWPALIAAADAATTAAAPGDTTTLLFVRWTADGEIVRTGSPDLYRESSGAEAGVFAWLEKVGERALTTYSNDLEDFPVVRCAEPAK